MEMRVGIGGIRNAEQEQEQECEHELQLGTRS